MLQESNKFREASGRGELNLALTEDEDMRMKRVVG